MLRSDENLTKTEILFIRILADIGLNEDEIVGTLLMIRTEEQMDKIVDKIEEMDGKMTHREAMNIIGRVIKEEQ